ncbi:hypothetical protein DASC09_056030 [Saccharomycopsis crataegensis]|uniref:L-type lectin-like domain-containing protein n=1 Tax=Saccharomycopsis crataegensis TaxID=43959 RepID=A0AAV5QUS3_9ASCO|nr:hypothetical protein DASC09_056030 [Saccharomycopsis crataegensis]
MDIGLLSFYIRRRISQSKPLRYTLWIITALLSLIFINKVFRGGNVTVPSGDSSYQGISSSNRDLTNEEINTLIAGGNLLQKHELPKFRLAMPYLNNEVDEQNYEFTGDVLIRNDQYVRLTSLKKHQKSSFFSNSQVDLQSFVMEWNFALSGNGEVSSLHGDGMAVLFSEYKLDQGEMFGVNEYYKGFGIYVDTYRNGRSGIFPYVLASRNDGTQRYDNDNDGKANEISGCIARSLWNPSSGVVKARLVYIEDGYVSLDFDYKNEGVWTNCFTLQEVYLPEKFHVGFSAQTGDLSEIVDIFEARIYSLKDHDGNPVTEFQKLVDVMNDPSSPDKFEDVTEEYQLDDHTKRRRVVSQKKDGKQMRRTLKRLINAEKRIKKEAEQRRVERRAKRSEWWNSVKKWFYFMIAAVVCYMATIVYRVQKKNNIRRSKNQGLIV